MTSPKFISFADAVLPGTPRSVLEQYQTLADRALTQEFGLIEDDVIVLDTETTGLDFKNSEVIEIAAARLRGREIVDTFQTFCKPKCGIIPENITQLTSITSGDVVDAPSAVEAVRELRDFVDGSPIIAHNATFDRHFIEKVRGGVFVSPTWIDSLALSRIALPRLKSHKLEDMANLFGCPSVSHRAMADVEALCGVWRILLVGLSDLPSPLISLLAQMHPDNEWSYRQIFTQLSLAHPGAGRFHLDAHRNRMIAQENLPHHMDADELLRLEMPTREQIDTEFSSQGLMGSMYENYERREAQVAMAQEVRDALATSTHRIIEAGTGVGKSMAYLLPFAYAAKMNNITLGVATKTNSLTDQLMYSDLPKIAQAIPGGLSYTALKGYTHYPCLRKLEHMARSNRVFDPRQGEDTLTAIAVMYAYATQSVDGDLDSLGIRWKSVGRENFTCSSKECTKAQCPFFNGQACFVHGARRRADSADIVVTNHSLLFADVAVDNAILPPIRNWVVDEAHSAENEARRQWAIKLDGGEMQVLFEALGGARSGALGRLSVECARSDAAALHLGLIGKAASAAPEASIALSTVFSAIRECIAAQPNNPHYSNVVVWVDQNLRASESFAPVTQALLLALDRTETLASRLSDIAAALTPQEPEKVIELNEIYGRVLQLQKNLKILSDGSDTSHVFAISANMREDAGGEAMTAELYDIGCAFADKWLPNMHSVIFTSATMSVSDSFDHMKKSVGLDLIDPSATKTAQMTSDYDYDSHMSILVPTNLAAPTSPAYLSQLEELLYQVHVAMDGSTLTLFTNRREMEEMYRRLRPRLLEKNLSLSCQQTGVAPKRLRDDFIKDEKRSLFALKAFWEGFDAPGNTLRCVVIPKLPFGNPNEPLARERDVRDKAAWAHYSLPDAVISLKQAAGRLIRTSTDTGVLVLADNRLVSKGYGKKFLNSMPTQHTEISVDHIGMYLEAWRKNHE